ncbi:DUF418 domain-containing protein [Streptomyces bohaiensis]|uniref:DUF418 domain-containing protein n=2 Tax=Streptomyces bohaiensis TaxID=1431344 RepID=A0ABX1CFU8_9ACTN|nr:DUF418 domain-containing protein [Streptomyces bohaiensis]
MTSTESTGGPPVPTAVASPVAMPRHAGTASEGAGSDRLPLLDLLRGVAILGTLMTNVWIFTAPGAEWSVLGGPLVTPDLSSVSEAAESAFRLLADGKFLALLTVLFGVGLAIQFDSAARRGEPWPGRYRWRAAFLFAEGALHFVLVFAWDVLMGYAVTALLVAWLLTRSERAQRRWLWWAAGGHLALMAACSALLLAAGSASEGEQQVAPSVVALYAEGGYGEQVAFRLENALALRLEPVLTFGLLVALFLLGARLYRAGAFGPDATGRRLRGRMLRWGLGTGLPLTVLFAFFGEGGFLLNRYVAAPLVALGYIGLVGALADRVRRPGRVATAATGALASVGRTALTCYVLQNVLCVLLAYGIGAGLAARIGPDAGPWWVMGLWAAVSAVLLAAASLWTRRFRHGPLEALQRAVLRR